MTFTVTYRAKDGALREERIEAANRAECVAVCRQRGIAPTKIAEGRSGKSAASPKGANGKDARSPSQRRLTGKAAILAAVALAAIAGGLWLWVSAHSESGPCQVAEKPKVEKPKGRDGARPSPKMADVKPTAVETNAAPVAVAPTVAAPTGNVIRARSSRSGHVMTLADGTVVTNTPRAFFKRDFERALHVALMPNGMGGTLLRQVRSRYTDEQILAMLKERVVVESGDDETTAAVKRKVQSFKDEVLRVIGEGASVSEVLDGMTRRKVEDGILRARAHKIRTEALRSDDPDAARKGIEAANAVLRENGLREMDVPQVLKADGEAAGGDAPQGLKASDGDAPQEKVSEETK